MKTTSEYIALLRKYMAENAYKYGIMRMGIFGSVHVVNRRRRAMWMFVLNCKHPACSVWFILKKSFNSYLAAR